MPNIKGIALHNLPVTTRPGYASLAALNRLHDTVQRVEKILSPNLFKKLLGGTNRDHSRAIVAACNEETKAIRGVFLQTKKAAKDSSDSVALEGAIERILKALDQWRDAASDFERAEIGADERLLTCTKKVLTLAADLKNPASGINSSN